LINGHALGAVAEPILQRPWKEALLWLLLLAPGFLAVYIGANLHTAQLPPGEIGEVAMAWERSIPFWPWTILPYFSIDLLYVISPFVCLTRRELRIHVLRFALVTAISASCFLLFPLRFGFARPEVHGVPGLLFDVLGAVDHPFNQAPSLHIGLLVVLWSCYRRRCPPRWAWLLHLGFSSIACSVLTTWQHHFLDVATGLIVGIAVCFLVRQSTD
jgi:membrane-associated phospholipid phosphatase